MLNSIISLIANAVASMLGGILLLRFWMQAIRVRPPGTVADFTFALTDWLVKPLRRIFPGFGGYDWASLISAVFVAVLLGMVEVVLQGRISLPLVIVLSVFSLLQWIFYGLTGVIVLGVIFSWVNPHAPLAPFIYALGDPLLRPLRRVVPLIGNIDLSPCVALLLLQVLLRVFMSLIIQVTPYFY